MAEYRVVAEHANVSADVVVEADSEEEAAEKVQLHPDADVEVTHTADVEDEEEDNEEERIIGGD